RLSRELLEVEEPEVLQYSLDRCYSTPSSYLELSDSCQPYRSAFYSLEKQHVGLVLGGDRIKKDQEEEEDESPPCPRLSRELLEGEEPEVLQYSLDRCYSTPSSYFELPDSCQPYKSAFYSLEEQHVGLALHVINIEKNQEEEEDQDPPCPRLSSELLEVEEQGAPQDSLDEVYLIPSLPPDLSDCQQPYSS
uniref:Olduvai domain-containing protein n=1 Tax=Chlorocebus sabaeus TaxID=60711 RepID=A0A0D9S0K7_CHLSB